MQTSNYVVKQKIGWKDPIALDVNFVQTGMEWTIDGDQVVYEGGNCRWYRFALWTDEGGTCVQRYQYNHTVIELDQTRDFSNDVFPCGNGNYGADTTYNPSRVGATVNGPFTTHYSAASGDCAWLLHKYRLSYSNW